MSVPITTTLALGFVLGLRHALDADHVAAVAALNASREGLRRALVNGFSWGAGHALTLGAAGGVALALRSAVPDRLALAFEFGVGLMLIVLGSAALRGVLRDRLHVHTHRHDDLGGAHGLAGSAALALLVLTEMPTVLAGCFYLLVFGAGSIAGMTLMSLVLGAPLVIARRRALWLARGLRAAAGLGSLGIGLAILWETGVTGGLFG